MERSTEALPLAALAEPVEVREPYGEAPPEPPARSCRKFETKQFC